MADYIYRIKREDITSVDLDHLELSDELTYFLYPKTVYLQLMGLLNTSNQRAEIDNVKIYLYEKIKDNIPADVYESLLPLEYHFPNMRSVIKKPALMVSRFKKEDLEKIVNNIVSWDTRK